MAVGFIFVVLCSQGVLAFGTEKTLTASYNEDLLIASGDYKAFIVHLTPKDSMMLTVRVGLGEEIDVYTMAKSDYEDYKGTAQFIEYFSQYSKESLKYFEYSGRFTPAREGDYVVVIDNQPKTQSGAPGAQPVSCSVKIDLAFEAPFPWPIVVAAIALVAVLVVVVGFFYWMGKKKAQIAEAEAQKKRAEAAKVRPIFINPQAPAAPGVPPGAAAPVLQAPPPSSSCKSCPHVYDPTSANCIACEYR
ncbi:MAG: hypothetical protein FJ149_06535 [Euryarchaeota archaeon]|nr:hypothetical protein [Euryarchaeota archaeon]